MKHHFYTFGLLLAVASNVQAATVTKTTITKTSVTPTSAPAGTMFKFSATLNAPLTTGNKVKIDLGKGLASMTGTKTSYSLSRAIYTIGSQTYNVGIYNAKNVLQGKVSNGNYTVTSIFKKNNPPTLALIKADTTATTNTAYTVTFNAKDIDANLNSITMNWGDNSEPETLAAIESKDLVFSHIYTSASSFSWNVFASDKGTPALKSKSVSKTITVESPVVEIQTPESKYTKVCNSGAFSGEEDCPINPVLGNEPTDWGCTQDNNTGLVWEIKTKDGIRGVNEGYTNAGDVYIASWLKTESDSPAYILKVNKETLCGADDWRMPTADELLTLLFCSDGKYDEKNRCASNFYSIEHPTIDTEYFPDKGEGNWYWSSTDDKTNKLSSKQFGWSIDFYSGDSNSSFKGQTGVIRLVR